MMTSITAESISMMPIARRRVNSSPKSVQDITTAVSGSRAPIIAVGVDPMLFMATLMRKRLSTVGSNASCMPQIH